MDAERRRVLLAEDHEVVGQGIKALLAPTYEVLGPVRNGNEVIEAITAGQPQAVVLDITMPGRNGLDLLPEIVRKFPRIPVVMLTGNADLVIGRTALLFGAMAFLPKDSGIDELELALRTVFHGRKYLSPRLPPSGFPAAGVEALPSNWAQLTPRQLKVLKLIGEGKDTEGIAEALGISAHTVQFHRRGLRSTLGIDTDAGLARIALLFRVHEEHPDR
jgi:two-component system secretion response regulator SsrB